MAAGRPNVIDSHPDKLMIVRELLLKKSHRVIAAKYSLSPDAVDRYAKRELNRYVVNGINPRELVQSQVRSEEDKAVTDFVMQDLQAVRGTSNKLLSSILAGMPADGKLACDPKGAAAVMRGLLSAAELQARLEGRLQDKGSTQVNVVILSSHSSTAPEPQPQPETPAAPGDQVLDAEWSEISPGD